jgi:hypothetical protein
MTTAVPGSLRKDRDDEPVCFESLMVSDVDVDVDDDDDDVDDVDGVEVRCVGEK